jgi:hypothetical protein
VVARQQNQRHQKFNAPLLPSGHYCGHGCVAIFNNQSRALRQQYLKTKVPFHVQRNPYGIKQKQKKSIFIYGTTFRKILRIPIFLASPNLFYRSQKTKKNYGSHPLRLRETCDKLDKKGSF